MFRTHIKTVFYAAKHKHSTCPRAYAVKYASTPAELRVYIPKPEIRAMKPDVRALNPRVRTVKLDVRAVKCFYLKVFTQISKEALKLRINVEPGDSENGV